MRAHNVVALLDGLKMVDDDLLPPFKEPGRHVLVGLVHVEPELLAKRVDLLGLDDCVLPGPFDAYGACANREPTPRMGARPPVVLPDVRQGSLGRGQPPLAISIRAHVVLVRSPPGLHFS